MFLLLRLLPLDLVLKTLSLCLGYATLLLHLSLIKVWETIIEAILIVQLELGLFLNYLGYRFPVLLEDLGRDTRAVQCRQDQYAVVRVSLSLLQPVDQLSDLLAISGFLPLVCL